MVIDLDKDDTDVEQNLIDYDQNDDFTDPDNPNRNKLQ